METQLQLALIDTDDPVRIPLRECKRFLAGLVGEEAVFNLLAERGNVVIPLAAIERNKTAPLSVRTGHVLPDSQVLTGEGRSIFVEIKVKRKADYTYITGREEHGIGINKFKRYRQIEKDTGCEVWLCIVETSTREVLVSSLRRLAPVTRYYDGNLMDPGGMCFWPKSAFFLLGHVDLNPRSAIAART